MTGDMKMIQRLLSISATGLHKIFLILIMMAAPVAPVHSASIDIVLDLLTSTQNNASIQTSSECVSNGLLTSTNNPVSG